MDFDITNISEIGLSRLLDREIVRELFTAIGDLVRVEMALLDVNRKRYSEIRIAEQKLCLEIRDSLERIQCNRLSRTIINNLPSSGMKRVDCEVGLSYLVSPLDYETDVVGYVIMGPYISPENKEKIYQFFNTYGNEDPDFNQVISSYRVLSNQEASHLLKSVKQMLSAFLFGSYKMFLTSKMHLESEKENYAEIEILNNRLNEMLSEVESVSRYKTAFIKTITHELKTPLTSIIGYSDILRKECEGKNGEIMQYIETINQKGIALLKIINDILILSSIESGTICVVKEKRDLFVDLREVMDSFYKDIEKKALRVSFSPQIEEPFFEYDQEKVKDIIARVMENSIKFSEEGGSIAIFVYKKDVSPEDAGERFGVNPKRYLAITVEDTAAGIDQDKIHMIFEPFYQAVSNMDTREKSGIGLGLKIARGFAEAMGGRLQIESEVGIGTKVTLLLPAD